MAFSVEAINVGVPLVNDIINNFLVNFDTIAISAIAIAIYAIIIWHYYRLLARRDFFHFEGVKGDGTWVWFLNFLEELEFLVKYIIFYPLLSFIFFGIFSVMMFLLSKEQSIPVILITSASIIAATRITAYYNEDLAKDLAKLIPFALLGIFIVQTDFLSTGLLVERITTLPNFFVDIASFILFFLVLEIGLRLLYGAKKVIFSDKPTRRQIRKEIHVEAEKIKQEIAKGVE